MDHGQWKNTESAPSPRPAWARPQDSAIRSVHAQVHGPPPHRQQTLTGFDSDGLFSRLRAVMVMRILQDTHTITYHPAEKEHRFTIDYKAGMKH
jgi:hypothetical protein